MRGIRRLVVTRLWRNVEFDHWTTQGVWLLLKRKLQRAGLVMAEVFWTNCFLNSSALPRIGQSRIMVCT
jgi:hypothetical protein